MIKARLSPRSAQILVILLIALAILSILVVAVASTARRDQVSRIQNEQYEQSLSIGEEVILEIVREELDIAEDCDLITGSTQYECDYEITSDSTGALEAFTVIVSEEVSSEVQNLTVGVDKGVSINLDNGSDTGFTGSMSITWAEPNNTTVSLAISVDYLSSEGYKTVRMLVDNGNLFTNEESTDICSAISGDDNSRVINFGNIRDNLDCMNNNGKLLAVRLIPMATSPATAFTSMSITGVGGGQILPQFKKITTQVYSKNASNTSTPVAILEATIPLNSNPLEFLDYVYRSGP